MDGLMWVGAAWISLFVFGPMGIVLVHNFYRKGINTLETTLLLITVICSIFSASYLFSRIVNGF